MSAILILNHDITVPKYHGTSHLLYVNFRVIHESNICGINHYCIIVIGGNYINVSHQINNIPYMPKSVLDLIPKFQVYDYENVSDIEVVVTRFKKQIENKLDEDPILRQLRKFNIVDEIQQLKKSVLPSKEITELKKTSSKLNSDTSQLTKLLHEEKEKTIQTELVVLKLLQEKENHDSEMLSMKSCIQQLQEDMKMLFRKTSELHYENTVLTKMVEEEKIKNKLSESTGLSFTQANTIGQALMQQDVFNCM
jgi:hypothetical protein